MELEIDYGRISLPKEAETEGPRNLKLYGMDNIQSLTKYRLVFVVVISTLLSYLSLGAQIPSTPFFDLEVQGIPFYKKVNRLFEDSKGLLWIGTNAGLYRYDGTQLKAYQYDVFDDESIPNNTIRQIEEDKDGDLWITTESYLVLYRRKQDRFIPFFKNHNSGFLHVNEDGTLLLNQYRRALIEITPHEQTDSILFDTIYSVDLDDRFLEFGNCKAAYEDEFGRRWVGTTSGIFFINEQNKVIPTKINFPVSHILKGKDQVLWIGSENNLFEIQYSKYHNDFEILARHELNCGGKDRPESITALVQGRDRTIWVGTDKCLFRGTLVYGSYQFKNSFNSTQSINNRITALTIDHYQNLWVGTVKGVSKWISKAAIFHFETLGVLGDNVESNVVNTIYRDDKANLWIGTNDSGIFRYNQSTKEVVKVAIPENLISVIRPHMDPDKLLVGTQTAIYELSELNSRSIGVKKLAEYERNVMDILPVSSDEIWVGLWGIGVRILGGKRELPEYKKAVIEQVHDNHVSVLHKDGYNNIWIGTRGNGLHLIDQEAETYKVFTPSQKEGITANAFLSIWEDFESNIWLGTRGGGLISYDQQKRTFQAFTAKDGLPSNTIATVMGDHKHNLWLSSRDGLAIYTPADGTFTTFGSEYGINTEDFSFKSGAQSSDQRQLYFGTIGGYYHIDAERYKKNLVPPKTIITSFRSYGQLKDSSLYQLDLSHLQNQMEDLVLPYQQNNLTIGFSSNDLTAPVKNKYAYKLVGVNDYWIFPSSSARDAVYFDLAPGTYVFQVKSSNSDGVWAEEPTTLTVTIKPPFWKSPWAYVLYAIFFLWLAWILLVLYRRWYRLKRHLLKEKISREKDNQHHQMRMVFFTDISHELRTPLTLILSYIEDIISNRKDRIDRKVAFRVYNNALKMKQLINQFMDIRKHNEKQFQLKVKVCDANRLVKSIEVPFMDFAQIHDLELKYLAPEQEIKGYLDYFIVEKVVSNLLINAFKYTAEGGQINLTVKERMIRERTTDDFQLEVGRYLEIQIRDNGIGIAPEDLEHIFDRYYQAKELSSGQFGGTGIGMELVYKLVCLHHGGIWVSSEKEVFTEFTVCLPLERKHYKEEEIILTQNEELSPFNPIDSPSTIIPLPPEDIPIHTSDKRKRKVLIVDDNPDLREMMHEFLQEEYQVIEAQNGQDGIALALHEKPNLIISDILMPVEDGITLLKKLKQSPGVNHIPIFMLTAKTDDVTKERCIKQGAQDFLEKPFSMEFLKWKIMNTLKFQDSLKKAYSKTITAEPTNRPVESTDERMMRELIGIVEEHLHSHKLNVEFLASEVGMSRANLYRKLQKVANQTPVNFIKQIRLKRAKQILETDKFYISEVAYMCGFNSVKYFRRCFQKEYGLTPSQYVQKSQELRSAGLT